MGLLSVSREPVGPRDRFCARASFGRVALQLAQGIQSLAFFAGAAASVVLSSPAHTDPAPNSPAFTRTTSGAVGTVVPDGVCGFSGNVVGGGGASSGTATTVGGLGGGGATINATFKVLPLQSVTVTVASGGIGSSTAAPSNGGTGANAGGNGGLILASSTTFHKGGGGGGSSSISVAGTQLILSGGGGGGGAAHQVAPAGNGGSGGFSGVAPGVAAAGVNGSLGSQATGVVGFGQGGQMAAGGTGGVNTPAGAFNYNGLPGMGVGTGTGGGGGADNGIDSGGGGGGGYTGGGGGASTNGDGRTGGGGGGGASFVRSASPTVAAPAPTSVSGAGVAGPAAGVQNGPNGSATLTWIPCSYTLSVAKSATPSTVSAGGRTVWTVSVSNTGPDPMTRGDTLTLADTLPAGPNGAPSPAYRVLSIVTSGGSNADMSSGAVTCSGVTVGSAMPAGTTCARPYSAPSAPGAPTGGTRGLNAGETLTITYEQIISNTASCGSITNTATARDRDAAGVTTLRTANAPLAINCYDLAVTKTANPTVQSAGNVITWTVIASNLGPGPMSGPDDTASNPLIVNDAAPVANVGTPVSFTSSGPAGACTYAAGVITCPGNLAASQSQTFTFQQTVNAGAPNGAVITNTASVTDAKTGDTDSANASVTVAAKPRLTLLKAVTNDNGGTNVDTDFTLTATGPTTVTGIEGVASITNAIVDPGTYVLTESGPATVNYIQGSWSCTAGTLTGNSLALLAGQTASCAITNNDKPRLTLLKNVMNNNGGSALDTDFTLTATGPMTVTGVEGGAAISNAAVLAGTYALSEAALAGYTSGAWSCIGGTLAGSNVTLSQAQNAVCTVTNDDQPATLTLTKVIVNTGGGTAALSSFPITAAGPTTITGTSGAAAVTGAFVNAGTYALSEITNSSYAASAWFCSGGTLLGSSLTLALGQSASCAITNTFVPAPALTIQKTADTAGPLAVGQTVNYSYLVENTGNVTITGVNVAEAAFNGSGLPPSPVAGGSTTLSPGQSVLFTAPYIVTQQDVDTLQ
jgi:uncharacterized repeat protein (TIGR01451 family)